MLSLALAPSRKQAMGETSLALELALDKELQYHEHTIPAVKFSEHSISKVKVYVILRNDSGMAFFFK